MDTCQDKIFSDNYASFVVRYNGNPAELTEKFNTDCYSLITNDLAVVYVPVGEEMSEILNRYYSVPKCYGLLDNSSVEDTGVLRLRRQPFINLYGQNILVGIVDTGIDYTHPVFQFGDGTTRIQSIWDQTIPSGNPDVRFNYGSIYGREDINEAIASENPFDVVPSRDEVGHGTFLAGIEAGNDMESEDFTGIAPLADIVVVKLRQAKQHLKDFFFIPEGEECYTDNDILMGMAYIFWIGVQVEKPVVLLLGIGTNSGDHNGSSYLGRFLGGSTNPVGFASVLAAGNEGNKGHHYRGLSSATEAYQDVELRVGDKENGFMLEFWAETPGLYSIAFVSPTGEYSDKIPARTSRPIDIDFVFEGAQITVLFGIFEPLSGDQLIWMRFSKPTPGLWKIRLFREDSFGGRYDLWLPMEHFISNDTYFTMPDPDTTICEPANVMAPITVAAYNHLTGSLYSESSRGYTRSGGIKPDLTAPGVNVFGPLPGGTYGTMSGTSVAAAHIAGISALLLDWGFTQGNDTSLSGLQIKKQLIRGARRTNLVYPNKEWGYGVVDIYRSFETLRRTE